MARTPKRITVNPAKSPEQQAIDDKRAQREAITQQMIALKEKARALTDEINEAEGMQRPKTRQRGTTAQVILPNKKD